MTSKKERMEMMKLITVRDEEERQRGQEVFREFAMVLLTCQYREFAMVLLRCQYRDDPAM